MGGRLPSELAGGRGSPTNASLGGGGGNDSGGFCGTPGQAELRHRSMARRGIVIACEDVPLWDHVPSLFSERLTEPAVEWRVVRVALGERLDTSDIATTDAVIVTGSHYSANDEHAWITHLCDWLREAAASVPGPRIVGVCFGHQIVARALGGTVSRNRDGRFLLQVEALRPTPAFADLPEARGIVDLDPSSGEIRTRASGFPCRVAPSSSAYADERARHTPAEDMSSEEASASSSRSGSVVDNNDQYNVLSVIESHGDCVSVLPPGAERSFTSASTDNEGFLMRDITGAVRVLTVQGHPELLAAEVEEKILPRVRPHIGEVGESLWHTTKGRVAHDWALLEVFRRFLLQRDAPERD